MRLPLSRSFRNRLKGHPLVAWVASTRQALADARRYTRYAQTIEAPGHALTSAQIEGQLTRDYHRVEKGLALPEPRRPFGEDLLERLDAYIPLAEHIAPDADYLKAAIAARDALRAWNSGGPIDSSVAPVAPVASDAVRERPGAVFFESRHSVRDFADAPVPTALLEEAIRRATYAPSVCNREPWRVRLYTGDEISRLLRYQNGNRGFGHTVPALALVSVELGAFQGTGEQNQAWIEGGIFSGTLVLTLHSVGLSSVMLNLSQPTHRLSALRQATGMLESEVPIVMIAVGYPRQPHRYARSVRRSPADILGR